MGNGVERSAGSASNGVLVALMILCLLGAAFALLAPRLMTRT